MRLFKKKKPEKPVYPHAGYDKPGNTNIKFIHSGNCGDIIYSLPTIAALDNERQDSELYLKINHPANYYKGAKHPSGNVWLNHKMGEMIIPLVEKQSYIKKCGIYENQFIDIDLDIFRSVSFKLEMNSIPNFYFITFNVYYDIATPWLVSDKKQEYQDYIVIARSERYRNPAIDYSFLKNYEKKIFLGVEQEYNDIKKYIPNIEWVQVKDFLEMAEIINGCKLFIGNQSFPFAIAEGLKVPRALEMCLFAPNVIPTGGVGRNFIFQDAFEEIVSSVVNK